MGLDLYAGPLTRYYRRNWKTIVEQAAGEDSVYFYDSEGNPITYGLDEDVSDTEIHIGRWQQNITNHLNEALGTNLIIWKDTNTLPYFTDKPGTAMNALIAAMTAHTHSFHIPSFYPEASRLDLSFLNSVRTEDPIVKVSINQGATFWLPLDFDTLISLPVPYGPGPVKATGVRRLVNELDYINSLLWNASPDDIAHWRENEGPSAAYYLPPYRVRDAGFEIGDTTEHIRVVDLESEAQFAFSLLWKTAHYAYNNNVPLLFDA